MGVDEPEHDDHALPIERYLLLPVSPWISDLPPKVVKRPPFTARALGVGKSSGRPARRRAVGVRVAPPPRAALLKSALGSVACMRNSSHTAGVVVDTDKGTALNSVFSLLADGEP